MARPAEMSREEIVGRLAGLFGQSGFEGVSLSDVARATGLGKSSLYHHFPGGKADMAEAVMRRVLDWAATHIVAPLGAPLPHGERVAAMLAAVDGVYDGGRRACVAASLLPGCAESGVAGLLRTFVSTWRDAIAGALREAGLPSGEAQARALDALARIQGSLVLARALDDPEPFRRALERVRASLLAVPGGGPVAMDASCGKERR